MSKYFYSNKLEQYLARYWAFSKKHCLENSPGGWGRECVSGSYPMYQCVFINCDLLDWMLQVY